MHTTEELEPTAVEYVPTVQFVHTLALLAPVTFEYLPAEQLVHMTTPAGAYDPAAHGTHTPFTLKEPAAHGQVYVSS
jgi:hypothetical protein